MTVWLVAREFFKRSFSPGALIALGVFGIFFFILVSFCFAGAFYSQCANCGWRKAASISYHVVVAWGVFFAATLAARVASRPLDDGCAALLLPKPVRRSHVVLGQLLGVFLAALAAVAGLAALESVLSLVWADVFPWKLWLALAVASLSFGLVVSLVAFFSLFMHRVVAGTLAIIFYLASFWIRTDVLRDIIAPGFKDAGLEYPWYARWGAEFYCAVMPPIAGIQIRAGELLGLDGWNVDGWLTVAKAVVYVVLFFVATWALYARRDV